MAAEADAVDRSHDAFYAKAIAGLFFIGAVLGTIAVFWPGAVPHPVWWVLVPDLVLTLAFTALVYFRPHVTRGHVDLAYPGLILVTAAVLASGGETSPLWPLYFIIVVGSATLAPFRRVLPVAAGAALLSLVPILTGGAVPHFVAREVVVIGLMFVIGAISAYISSDAREQRRMRSLLEEIFRASSFKPGDELSSILGGVVAVLRRLTRADYVICYLMSEDGEQLLPEAADISPGVPDDEASVLRSWPVPIGLGVTGWVARSGEQLMTGDLEQDPRSSVIPGTPDVATSAIFMPLKLEERVVGVLRVSHRGSGFFTENDAGMAQAFAQYATFAIQNARLFAETRHLYRKMRLLSITDGLTGLHNQRYLNEEAPRLLQEAKDSGQPLSCLMIDSDCLKSVNDQFGHALGDEFLRELASVIRGEVRSGDLVVRYAGDEFIALLTGAGSEAARQVAERIRVAAQHMNIGIDFPLAVSIGIATYPDHADDLDKLLRAADQALYISKGAGRNCSTVFHLAAN